MDRVAARLLRKYGLAESAQAARERPCGSYEPVVFETDWEE